MADSLSLSDLSSYAGQTWLPLSGHGKVAEVRYATADYWVTTGKAGHWLTESYCCHAGTLVYTSKAAAEAALKQEIARHAAISARCG